MPDYRHPSYDRHLLEDILVILLMTLALLLIELIPFIWIVDIFVSLPIVCSLELMLCETILFFMSYVGHQCVVIIPTHWTHFYYDM